MDKDLLTPTPGWDEAVTGSARDRHGAFVEALFGMLSGVPLCPPGPAGGPAPGPLRGLRPGPENRLHAFPGVPSVVRVISQTRRRPLLY